MAAGLGNGSNNSGVFGTIRAQQMRPFGNQLTIASNDAQNRIVVSDASVSFAGNIEFGGLTANEVVVTDSDGILRTMPYAINATNSSLVRRTTTGAGRFNGIYLPDVETDFVPIGQNDDGLVSGGLLATTAAPVGTDRTVALRAANGDLTVRTLHYTELDPPVSGGSTVQPWVSFTGWDDSTGYNYKPTALTSSSTPTGSVSAGDCRRDNTGDVLFSWRTSVSTVWELVGVAGCWLRVQVSAHWNDANGDQRLAAILNDTNSAPLDASNLIPPTGTLLPMPAFNPSATNRRMVWYYEHPSGRNVTTYDFETFLPAGQTMVIKRPATALTDLYALNRVLIVPQV